MNTVTTFLAAISILICTTQYISTATEQNVTPFLNKRLQSNINSLFYHLKIDNNFRRSFKIKVLLIMYVNLNNAIEYNWKIYSNLRKKVAIPRNVTDNLLYNVVEEALHDYQEYLDVTAELNKSKSIEFIKSTQDDEDENYFKNTTINNTAVSATTNDSNIIKKFVDNIDKLTVHDIMGEPVNKTYLEINKERRYKMPFRRNLQLKTWDPNEFINSTNNRRMNTAQLVEKYPFIASVHVRNKFACTGSIISKEAVLTAASCLKEAKNIRTFLKTTPNMITVRIGSDFADKYGEVVPALDVNIHPQYEPRTMKNNLAIIRLKLQKHAWNRPKIRKIRLDSLTDERRSIQVLGYGTGKGDSKKIKLEVGSLDMFPMNSCSNVYTRTLFSTDNFCAGVKSKRTGSTNCGAGGPVVSGGYLVGIVSYGPPVCSKGSAPSVFTKISLYMEWIVLALHQNWKTQSSALPTSSGGKFKSTRMYYDDDDPKLWTKASRDRKKKSGKQKKHTRENEVKKKVSEDKTTVVDDEQINNSNSFVDLTLLRNKGSSHSKTKKSVKKINKKEPLLGSVVDMDTIVKIEAVTLKSTTPTPIYLDDDHPVQLAVNYYTTKSRSTLKKKSKKHIPRSHVDMSQALNLLNMAKKQLEEPISEDIPTLSTLKSVFLYNPGNNYFDESEVELAREGKTRNEPYSLESLSILAYTTNPITTTSNEKQEASTRSYNENQYVNFPYEPSESSSEQSNLEIAAENNFEMAAEDNLQIVVKNNKKISLKPNLKTYDNFAKSNKEQKGSNIKQQTKNISDEFSEESGNKDTEENTVTTDANKEEGTHHSTSEEAATNVGNDKYEKFTRKIPDNDNTEETDDDDENIKVTAKNAITDDQNDEITSKHPSKKNKVTTDDSDTKESSSKSVENKNTSTSDESKSSEDEKSIRQIKRNKQATEIKGFNILLTTPHLNKFVPDIGLPEDLPYKKLVKQNSEEVDYYIKHMIDKNSVTVYNILRTKTNIPRISTREVIWDDIKEYLVKNNYNHISVK
ncbi:uncharacterized protein LOC128679579 isoform X1 [Plodia interpunctella]|uniref:uncharacterized protein LOC128679579 isoform X1 n=1 Tax=Plodia interpunctella TaxID=58824 RepID=UPI00236814E0|nr:uncharacterized protein LOC128679579 isoform X1 [Plodia interpunctella]